MTQLRKLNHAEACALLGTAYTAAWPIPRSPYFPPIICRVFGRATQFPDVDDAKTQEMATMADSAAYRWLGWIHMERQRLVSQQPFMRRWWRASDRQDAKRFAGERDGMDAAIKRAKARDLPKVDLDIAENFPEVAMPGTRLWMILPANQLVLDDWSPPKLLSAVITGVHARSLLERNGGDGSTVTCGYEARYAISVDDADHPHWNGETSPLWTCWEGEFGRASDFGRPDLARAYMDRDEAMNRLRASADCTERLAEQTKQLIKELEERCPEPSQTL